MILRSLLRRPSAVQSIATAAPIASPRATPRARSLYTLPTLDKHDDLVRDGIKDLLSAKAFNIAYTEYHQSIVDELSQATAGSPHDGQQVKDLVIEVARDPTKAYLFNLASMAWNNHFFFKGIQAPREDVITEPSTDVVAAVNETFSSLDSLRETFLLTAESMFGPGFVWLVQINDGTASPKLRILPTYIAGSPLSGAHYRKQSVDLSGHSVDSFRELNPVGSFGKDSAQQVKRAQKPLGGVDVVPLLCVNTWEHVWLTDYGVRGKVDYLERWWKKINWSTVNDLGQFKKPSQRASEQRQHQNRFMRSR